MELLNMTSVIDYDFWKFHLFGPIFSFSIFMGSLMGIIDWLTYTYNLNKPGYLEFLKYI